MSVVEVELAEPGAIVLPTASWRRVAATLLRNKLVVAALAFLLLLAVCAIFAPLIASHNPTEQNLLSSDLPPGSHGYLLGTDQYGEDLFSRVLFGARTSLVIGLLVSSVSAAIGLLLGMTAGIAEGVVEGVILRVGDVLFSLPFYVIAIAVAALFGAYLTTLVVLLSVWGWPTVARTVAVATSQLKRSEFIAAARLNGLSWAAVMRRHVVPNVIGNVIVLWSTSVGVIILTESALSFVGLGVQAPSFDWGSMLAGAQDQLQTAWWVGVFPGVALTLTIVSFYLIGDALRDALNPVGEASL